MEYILITSIKSKLSESEVLKVAKNRECYFKTVPGLIKKSWIIDEKTGIYHGIFEFESKQDLDNYLKTDFAKSVSVAYQTREAVKIQVLKVKKEQTN